MEATEAEVSLTWWRAGKDLRLSMVEDVLLEARMGAIDLLSFIAASFEPSKKGS